MDKTILQNKVDMAEDMGIPGLLMQEGFMNGLLTGSYEILDQPDPDQMEAALSKGNVLVLLDPASEAGKIVMSGLPADWEWPRKLKSHHYENAGLIRADLFLLEKGGNTLFVASSPEAGTRQELRDLIEHTGRILNKYKLHKGWFGAEYLVEECYLWQRASN